MLVIQLFLIFVKIGFITIGGGYAMLPLIQNELVSHNWLSVAEFVDILAVSEMTPGPIAVNSATFVGFRIAGIPGAIAATTGVAMPSVLLIILAVTLVFRFESHPLNKVIFYFVRPIVAGLLAYAALLVAQTALAISGTAGISSWMNIDWRSAVIFSISLAVVLKIKLNPIWVILSAALVGMLIF